MQHFKTPFINGCMLRFVLTETEAVEACKWLRAAGFPQYAQMYEGELLYEIV